VGRGVLGTHRVAILLVISDNQIELVDLCLLGLHP